MITGEAQLEGCGHCAVRALICRQPGTQVPAVLAFLLIGHRWSLGKVSGSPVVYPGPTGPSSPAFVICRRFLRVLTVDPGLLRETHDAIHLSCRNAVLCMLSIKLTKWSLVEQ
jgi:hypothetical protein